MNHTHFSLTTLTKVGPLITHRPVVRSQTPHMSNRHQTQMVQNTLDSNLRIRIIDQSANLRNMWIEVSLPHPPNLGIRIIDQPTSGTCGSRYRYLTL